jgi:hypothetical protein
MFILFHLAKMLFNRNAGYISILLIGFLPWQVWLGISMTESTMYFASILGAFFYFIKWQKENKVSFLLGASIFFLFSTMFRPEGWIFAALFSTYLIFFFIKHYRSLKIKSIIILAIIIPNIFALLWLINNYIEFGNPIYFLQAQRLGIQKNIDRYAISWLIEAKKWHIIGIKNIFLMFIISPILFFLITAGTIFRFRNLKNFQRNCVLFTLAQLVILTLTSATTESAPQRYVLINVILLSPFAANMLNNALQKRRCYKFIISILVIFVMINWVKSFYFPTHYDDAVKTGKYLKEQFRLGLITNSEQICSEFAYRFISGKLSNNYKDLILQSSAHGALAAYSGKPGNFMFNILHLPETHKITENQGVKDINNFNNIYTINSKLKKMQVKKIILESRELAGFIPHNFYLEKIIGKYIIFSSNELEKRFPEYKHEIDRKMKMINKSISKKVNIKGYKYEGFIFPHTLSILWELNKEVSIMKPHKLKITFSNLLEPKIKFERILKPIFYWYKIDSISNSFFVRDNIPLYLPPGMPSGDYSVKISFAEHNPANFKTKVLKNGLSQMEIYISNVTLISSRRDVLADFLRSRNRDWKLLVKTLIVL